MHPPRRSRPAVVVGVVPGASPFLHLGLEQVAAAVDELVAHAALDGLHRAVVPLVELLHDLERPPSLDDVAPDHLGFHQLGGLRVARGTELIRRVAEHLVGMANEVVELVEVASGALDPDYRPDLTDTSPTDLLGPHPQWHEPDRIVSIDPFGAVVSEAFADYFARGFDIRPTTRL